MRVAPKTPRSHRNEGDEPVELWAISKQLGRGDATKIDDVLGGLAGGGADALTARSGKRITASSCSPDSGPTASGVAALGAQPVEHEAEIAAPQLGLDVARAVHDGAEHDMITGVSSGSASSRTTPAALARSKSSVTCARRRALASARHAPPWVLQVSSSFRPRSRACSSEPRSK